MRSPFPTKQALLAVGVLLGSLLLVGVLYYLRSSDTPPLDALMEKVLDQVAATHAYTQHVETDIDLEGRHMRVVGVYDIDASVGSFASHSTTTFSIPDAPPKERDHVFTLENISIGDDVYTKIQTNSKLLQSTIPHSLDWKHFRKNAIPPQFVNIATPEPILDNLSLFGAHGKYIALVKNYGEEERGGETLSHYTFKLSEHASGAGGAVGALAERLGESGAIDVWVNASGATLRYLEFRNGSYRSTTAISGINNLPPITPPRVVLMLE
jgi:hypothetical protein